MTRAPWRLKTNCTNALIVCLAAFGCIPCIAVEPINATNVTLYHINRLSELQAGGAPVNMNTANAAGDLIFLLMERYMYPLLCPPGAKGMACENLEVHSKDLVISRVRLTVNSMFGPYAPCNEGNNGTDGHGHQCPDGAYCCYSGKPGTVGFENVSAKLTAARWNECKVHGKPRDYICWLYRGVFKTTPEYPAYWYSTENTSMCLDIPPPPPGQCKLPPQQTMITFNPGDMHVVSSTVSSPEECCGLCGAASSLANCSSWLYNADNTLNCQLSSHPAIKATPSNFTFSSTSACAWRMVSLDRMVNTSCHANYFESWVEQSSTPEDQACFRSCGGIPGVSRNNSDPCWVRCFYGAVLGPEAGIPNATMPARGSMGGLPWAALVEAWEAPLQPNSTACPDLRPLLA